MSYKIVRHYYGPDTGYGVQPRWRTIETGLTLEQAQAHCQDPETSSFTCQTAARKRYTRRVGRWFDSYTQE